MLVLLIYLTFIAPIFNKFELLKDDAARAHRVADEALRLCGEGAVRDGRQPPLGARQRVFTGFGASKRIVDTLLARLSGQEIEAVLAHELGHFKRRHVMKRMLVSFVLSLVLLALLGWLAQRTWFYTGSASRRRSTRATRAPHSCCSSSRFRVPVSQRRSAASRRASTNSRPTRSRPARPTHRISSARFVKLYEDNASTLTPDPSHGLLLLASARIAADRPPDAARMSRPTSAAGPARVECATVEGRVIAAHGRHYIVAPDDGGPMLQCFPRGKKSDIAVGDRVVYELASADQASSSRSVSGATCCTVPTSSSKLFAANLDQLLIVLATGLLQRGPARPRADRRRGERAEAARRAEQDRRRSALPVARERSRPTAPLATTCLSCR